MLCINAKLLFLGVGDKKIWSVRKKVVILHPLSREEA